MADLIVYYLVVALIFIGVMILLFGGFVLVVGGWARNRLNPLPPPQPAPNPNPAQPAALANAAAANAAAAPPVVVTGWAKWLLKWGLILLGISLIGGLLLWGLTYVGLITAIVATTASTWLSSWLPYFILGVVALAIVAALMGLAWLFRQIGTINIDLKNGSFVWRLITGLFATFVVFLFLYEWDPRAPLFTTDEGRGHILMYGLAITASVMIMTHYKGVGLFSMGLLMFLLFWGLGESTVRLFPKFGPIVAQIKGKTYASRSSVSDPCNNVSVGPYQLGRAEPAIPNGASCQLNVHVEQGAVRLTGDRGYMDIAVGDVITIDTTYPGWRAQTIWPLYQGTIISKRLFH